MSKQIETVLMILAEHRAYVMGNPQTVSSLEMVWSMMNIEYRETRWISVQSGPRSFMLQARLRISCKVILF